MSLVIEERIVAIVARNALAEAFDVLSPGDFEDADMAKLWGALAEQKFDARAVHQVTGLGWLLKDLVENVAFCPTHLPSYVRIAMKCRDRRQFKSMTNRLRGGNAIRRI